MNLDTLSSGLQRSAPTCILVVLHPSDLVHQSGPNQYTSNRLTRRVRDQRARRPYLLGFPVDAVPASPSLAKQVGTMEPRDDVDAVTGPADATTALQGARATTIDLASAVTTLATPVSSQILAFGFSAACSLSRPPYVVRWCWMRPSFSHSSGYKLTRIPFPFTDSRSRDV